jgi:hypothetical protein
MSDIEIITVHDPADCDEAEALIRRLRALLQEFLDQCDNTGCSLCERGRAALGSDG